MPSAEAVDARAGVRQADGLETRLDRAVLAVRPVEGDEDDRCVGTGGQPVDGVADGLRSGRARARPGRRRSRAGGRRGDGRPASVHQRRSRSMTHRLHGDARIAQRVRDGRAGHDRHVVLRRRAAEEDDDRAAAEGAHGHGQPVQSPRKTISNARSTPWTSSHRRLHVLTEPAHVGSRALLVVDDEVGVLLGHDGAADPGALEPGRVDQPARRVAGRVREHAAGRRQAEGLVGLTPAADVVEARLDDVRIGGRQLERRLDDEVGDAVADPGA